jgi:hypothetical protein
MKKRRLLWGYMLLFTLWSSLSKADRDFNDGGIHDISAAGRYWIRVDYDTPDKYTTLNFLDGSSCSLIEAYEDSRINFMGGSLNSVVLGVEGRLESYGRSQVKISGGYISFGVFAAEQSMVEITGGAINSVLMDSPWGNPIREASITAFGNSMIDIKKVLLSDQSLVQAAADAMITIYGHNFALDGVSVGNGELVSLSNEILHLQPIRRLSGNFSDGSPFEFDFRIADNAKILLVPEPVTCLYFFLGSIIAIRKMLMS